VHQRHPDYQRQRRIWNYEQPVPLTVKGDDHSVAGLSLIDDWIVTDLRPLRRVTVDPDTGGVRVSGVYLHSEIDCATKLFGLAMSSVAMSENGAAGVALGAGMGWLSRKLGFTCDHLVSARVVLADGGSSLCRDHVRLVATVVDFGGELSVSRAQIIAGPAGWQ
jgi:FAD/FMN-containing dehydrogenase